MFILLVKKYINFYFNKSRAIKNLYQIDLNN